jgi:hypothetical protein
VEVDEAVLVAEPGTITNLATVAVPAARLGATCTLAAHSENQVSIHPGNDLLVTTGDQQTVIADVEARPDQVRELAVEVVLGPTVTVDLRMGPTRVSSLGFDITIDCPPAAVAQPEPVEDPSAPSVASPPPDVCVTGQEVAADGSVDGSAEGQTDAPAVSIASDECGDPAPAAPQATPEPPPAGADGTGGDDRDEERLRSVPDAEFGTDDDSGADPTPPLPESAPAAPVIAAPSYTG